MSEIDGIENANKIVSFMGTPSELIGELTRLREREKRLVEENRDLKALLENAVYWVPPSALELLAIIHKALEKKP